MTRYQILIYFGMMQTKPVRYLTRLRRHPLIFDRLFLQLAIPWKAQSLKALA